MIEAVFQVETLNALDLSKVPATVQKDLCRGAIEMALKNRETPGYKERFEKWLAAQKKTA